MTAIIKNVLKEIEEQVEEKGTYQKRVYLENVRMFCVVMLKLHVWVVFPTSGGMRVGVIWDSILFIMVDVMESSLQIILVQCLELAFLDAAEFDCWNQILIIVRSTSQHSAVWHSESDLKLVEP